MTLFRADPGALDTTRTILTTAGVTTALPSDPNNPQSIAKIRIVNMHTADVRATVDIFDGITGYVLANNRLIVTGDALEIYDEQLARDESLRVQSNNAAGLLHVHILAGLAKRIGG